MKPAILDLLNCPTCQSEFQLDVHAEEHVQLTAAEIASLERMHKDTAPYEVEIIQGSLTCPECKLRFPICNGIPRIYKDATSQHSEANGQTFKTEAMLVNKDERHVQKTFSREWEDHDYDENTIWLWTVDERIDTFCEELAIDSVDELRGKLMIDAGCGSGVLAMTLSERYQVEILAIDMSTVIDRAHGRNRSNLCHFVQTSVLNLPLRHSIADVTYSHGVLHHTYSTRKAFESISKLTKENGVLYVWLYGKKAGWNRVRFLFHRSARFVIARLPRIPQKLGVTCMGYLHLSLRQLKRICGFKVIEVKSRSHFWTGIWDKYTPKYAREHRADEVLKWFEQEEYRNAVRRIDFPKTEWWKDSENLSIRGFRGLRDNRDKVSNITV